MLAAFYYCFQIFPTAFCWVDAISSIFAKKTHSFLHIFQYHYKSKKRFDNKKIVCRFRPKEQDFQPANTVNLCIKIYSMVKKLIDF